MSRLKQISLAILILYLINASNGQSSQNNNGKIRELDLTNFFQDIVVSKSEGEPKSKSILLKSQFQYQVQLKITSLSGSPINFENCPFSSVFNSETTCLESYDVVVDANSVLHINTDNVLIQVRAVINGCSTPNQLRDIGYKTGQPIIFHESDDCVYRVINNNNTEEMLSLSILKFPSKDNITVCKPSIQISSTDSENDLIGNHQAFFYNKESIDSFGFDVYLANKYNLIRVSNCFETMNPIQINITNTKKIAGTFPPNKVKDSIDFSGLLPLSTDQSFIYGINSIDIRNKIKIRLTDYKIPNEGDCTSKLIIYGVDHTNQTRWYIHKCNNVLLMTQPIEFREFRTVFVQFRRDPTETPEPKIPHLFVRKSLESFSLDIAIEIRGKRFVKRFSLLAGRYNSLEKRQDLRDAYFEIEIKTQPGTQIMFNLTQFTSGRSEESVMSLANQVCGFESCQNICDDYAIIHLNKTTHKINSIIRNYDNPKICNWIEDHQVFYSYSNYLYITFSFSNKFLGKEEPFFEFSYSTVSSCDTTSNKFSDQLVYDSQMTNNLNKRECFKSIELPVDRQIIFYTIDWNLDENTYSLASLNHENEMINGKLKCKNMASLMISDIYPKYLSISNNTNVPNEEFNYYCIDNPMLTYVSKSNNVFLSYIHPSDISQNLNRPLAFQIGYFSFRNLYQESKKSFTVDFSKIIPANIDHSSLKYSVNFEIKIKVPENKYLIPSISKCNTQIDNGKIKIKADQRDYDFMMDCAGESYTTFTLMHSELIFEFHNVYLNELRNKEIRFSVNYNSLPRVLNKLEDSFQSNNFVSQYFDKHHEVVHYEWRIDIDQNYFIKLTIDTLTHTDQLTELTIFDGFNNAKLYEKEELIKNFEKTKFNYMFSTNKLKITFKYNRGSKSLLENLPFIKCSYKAQPRILNSNLGSIGGELVVSQTIIKEKLEWLIMAPADHSVLVKIKSYEGKGQLIFSMLNSGYNGNYHFNLDEHEPNPLKRRTDFVISKDNLIHIQYSPTQSIDSFTLVYSFINKYLTNPFDVIKPYTNDLTNQEVKSPKLTDQIWIIRAPYEKNIKMYVNYIDLLYEEPCSKASLNFYEFNQMSMISKCGRIDSNLKTLEMDSNLLFVSKSNELTVQFTTHEAHEVVFWVNTDKKSKSSKSNKDLSKPFKGFEIFYTFLEQTGDCYFQYKNRLTCGYTFGTRDGWRLVEENTKMFPEYSKYICSSCYMMAKVPIRPSFFFVNPILKSPSIDKSKQFVKFDYKLSANGQLFVKFLDDGLTPIDENSAVVLKEVEPSDDWKSETVKIGKTLHNFRILFILQRNTLIPSSLEVTAALDNIIFFEKDLECGSEMFPGTCLKPKKINENDKKSSIIMLGNQAHKNEVNICHINELPCDRNKCAKGSLCVNKLNENHDGDNYVCNCNFGYTGKYCDIKIDPCKYPEHNKCSLKSECISNLNENNINIIDNADSTHMNYHCKCKANYEGEFCDKVISPCKNADNPCHESDGHGTCTDKIDKITPSNSKYECQCSPLYTGDECEEQISNTCTNNLCIKYDKNATCIQLKYRVVCLCSFGFQFDTCTPVNDCRFNPCQNGGMCMDGLNSFKCKCNDRYAGQFCEIPKICQECNKIGTFFCNETTHECVCQTTHKGTHCETPIDPCEKKPCKNGACVSNKIDEYQCLCDDGYKGEHCDQKEAICDEVNCLNGGTCHEFHDESNELKFKCQCKPSYTGTYCETMLDLCQPNPCQNEAKCYNYIDDYTCGCYSGFTGKNCETEIDNCRKNLCHPGSTCQSLSESYICICQPGRIGRYCTETIDNCYNNLCQNGKCIATFGGPGYTCECMLGYEGEFCEKKIDYCYSDDGARCKNDGQCVDTIGKYQCKCPHKYRNNDCEETNFCSMNTTQCVMDNTLRCANYPGGNKCNCLNRYTGSRCESLISICDYLKPCRSGICVPLNQTHYECQNCSEGYTGKNCHQMIDYCKTMSPCKNDGVCLSKPAGYICQCPDGFTGKDCETKIERECLKHNCQHNSECVPLRDKSGGYKCICDDKHEGQYCEREIDICKNINCTPPNYCVKGVCECDYRYPFCNQTSKCNNYNCLNGGKCVEVIVFDKTVPKCICPPELTGEHCEFSVYCKSSPNVCGKPEQCKIFNENYKCDCGGPKIGHGCDKEIADLFPSFIGQLQEDKKEKELEDCRFGQSTSSRIFITLVVLFFVIFLAIGFFIGKRIVASYKKRANLNDSHHSKTTNNSTKSKDKLLSKIHDESCKTPMINNNNPYNDYPIKSGFTIPRPTVKIPKTYV